MKTKVLTLGFAFALSTASIYPLRAEEPLIPPTIMKVAPVGMERGTTATFAVEGRNLSGASEILFDSPGIHGALTEITDVAEVIGKARAGVDLNAQVPVGKKQSAKLEITVDKDVAPGIHRMRIDTPLGTTNSVAFAVGALPEITSAARPVPDAAMAPQQVELPATLIGTIAAPGETDQYQFAGKAGEELIFHVQASQLGSTLNSHLTLSDAATGRSLSEAGMHQNGPDAELIYKLPQDGNYIVAIADREKSGDADHYYRLIAGPLPYVSGVFPLGVRAGQPTTVAVSGVNLGDVHQVTVQPPASVEGWTTVPLDVARTGNPLVNQVVLAVGDEPEILKQESNGSVAQAQMLNLPVTVNGHIDGGVNGSTEGDYFRFHAKKGQRLNIAVAAARLGSPLDSVIEVLDMHGQPIPRATIRCLNQTMTTLYDKDSTDAGIRLVSKAGLHEGDYLMVGDELDQIGYMPDQPDSDIFMKATGDVRAMQGREYLRRAFLGTTTDVHPVNTLVYKVEVLAPGAEFPPNGLPIFHLNWRDDDGGPGYGADSKLDFVAPADGDYLLHLNDVRGMKGPDFAYRLTVRDDHPDYQIWATPANPNVPQGGSTPVTVAVDRIYGYDGPIEIQVKGLPAGITAAPATIAEGRTSTMVILSSAPGTSLKTRPTPITIVGAARIGDRDETRIANAMAPLAAPLMGAQSGPLQVVSVTPPPDVVVTTDLKEVTLERGKDATVTLYVARQNGFKGRVPCDVQNLPPGVRVVNLGLNGVLVTETQSSRTFVLHAEEWATPLQQPIYVVGQVESDSPTEHPSAPILVKVSGSKQLANNNQEKPLSSDAPRR